MMMKDTLHVVPHDDSWAVKRQGNERASSTHGTQKEAIDAARVLARDGDELVIHRPDGTIREQSTYSGSAAQNGHPVAASEGPSVLLSNQLRPSDVMSVGTRVSWGSVLAGVVVALALYLTLNLFVIAIGSSVEPTGSKTLAVGAVVVSTVCLFMALFVGGYVAGGTTVGENKTEAITYGVMVWATILLLLVTTGFGLGFGYFSMVRDIGRYTDLGMTADAMRHELSLTGTVSPAALAWWTFAGVVLSAVSAIGGALVGSGTELELAWLRGRRVVAVSPVGTEAKHG